LPYFLSKKTAVVVSMLFVPLMMAAIVVGIRKKTVMARYYLVSWMFPLTCTLIFTGLALGLPQGSSLAIYSLHFGVLCQSLFLSFTLSSHLREATRNASVLKV